MRRVGRILMTRSFYDTHDLLMPIVYGIVPMAGGSPVYIGMTTRPSQRMDNYRNVQRCTNARLAKWLTSNEAGFVVLYEGDDYKAQEAELIAASAGSLFNFVRGGDQNWRTHRKKPWMAKTGIPCPSDFALRMCGKDARAKDYRAWRDSLSDADRCLHEVGLAYSLRWHSAFMKSFKTWLSFTSDAVNNAMKTSNFSQPYRAS